MNCRLLRRDGFPIGGAPLGNDFYVTLRRWPTAWESGCILYANVVAESRNQVPHPIMP